MNRLLNNLFLKRGVSNPPWDYDFLYNLEEREYPKYLAKLFKLNTFENLPLKRDFKNGCFVIDKDKLQTFNQKIQWLKLYDDTPLKKLCTDKVTVRDYVKEKIGAEYLKPALQIITKDKFYINYSLIQSLRGISRSNPDESGFSAESSPDECSLSERRRRVRIQENKHWIAASGLRLPRNDGNMDMQIFNYPIECESLFEKIDFDRLPSSFVMKCSHGCGWQFFITDKNNYLNSRQEFEYTRRQMTGWLEQEFWAFAGFELQYKGLEPKIIIEPLMLENIEKESEKIQIYCFSGKPEFVLKFHGNNTETVYDKDLKQIEKIFISPERQVKKEADEIVKPAYELSAALSKDFIFARCDWMIYQSRLYFEELTFTPYSGFHIFENRHEALKLGSNIDLNRILEKKGGKNGF